MEMDEVETDEMIQDDPDLEVLPTDLDKALTRCLTGRREIEGCERAQSIRQILLRSLCRSSAMLRSLRESRIIEVSALTSDDG
jgi:hypothetical protein